MVSALYRRYRPEAFSELIGQAHVTDPLMAALRNDRVNHAYLFSGPRGCGKTTSARILARCLNCAKGPTDTPCGECDSCVELGRDGGGSIDVIEIDAASHGGVDDARDLRERATLAPNRDRFKIYIIDEAHMVSKDGFNALLKIVEEPPEHVKFIFATTEPEKVIGTIRSRTHHYPFRLIPPALLLDYVTGLAAQESVQVEPGVLPLVIRAGGGSARDTLSLLDQLMAGSEGTVTYERAVSLLGFTHAELLDDVTAALAANDSQGAFGAVERVMQTGQDPRRFVEDLLEHLRDLIIAAVTDDAESILHGVQAEEIERMRDRAHDFGPARLSQAADTVAKSLSSMSGATSPKLQLELLLARLLVTGDRPVAPREPRARVVEERHSTTDAQSEPRGPSAAANSARDAAEDTASGPDTAAKNRAASSSVSAQAAETSADDRGARSSAPEQRNASDSRPDLAAAAASFRGSASAPNAPAPSGASANAPAPTSQDAERSRPSAQAGERSDAATSAQAESTKKTTSGPAEAGEPAPANPATATSAAAASASASSPTHDEPAETEPNGISFKQIEDSWPEVLGLLESRSRRAWMVANAIRPVDFDVENDKIGLVFRSQGDMNDFRRGKDNGEMIWKVIQGALHQRFGKVLGFAPREGDAHQAGAPDTEVAGRGAQPGVADQPRSSQVTASQADADERATPTADDASAQPPSSSRPHSSEQAPRGNAGAAQPGQEQHGASRPVNASPPLQAATEYGSYEPPESYPEPDLPPEDPYATGGSGDAGPTSQAKASGANDPRQQPPGQRSGQANDAGAGGLASKPAGGGWAVAQIPQSEPERDSSVPDPWAEPMPNATVTVNERHDSAERAPQQSKMADALQDAPPPEPKKLSASESARYGEAVIREELGAEFIEEITDERGY